MKLQVVLVLLMASCAFATHFRYMTVSWSRSSASDTSVTINVEQAWRNNFSSWATNSVIGTGSLRLGDGNTRSISLTVTNRNLGENWLIGSFSFTHNYPSLQAFNLVFQSCCRISTLQNGNSDDFYRVRTSVNLASPILTSPQLTGLPIVTMFLNQQNIDRIPRVPPITAQGLMPDRLRFVLVPAGSPSNSASSDGVAGSGLTVNTPTSGPNSLSLSSDGVMTWTPTVAGLYAIQVEAECPDNIPVFTPLDFIIEVVQGTANLRPYFVDASGNQITQASITVVENQITTFVLRSFDPLQNDASIDNFVKWNLGNIPNGVTVSGCAEGEANGFSVTNVCTRTITLDGNVITQAGALAAEAEDANGGKSSQFPITYDFIDVTDPSECVGELHFKACTPAGDPTSQDCLSIYVDVGKLFNRQATGGLNFNLQNTCGGSLDASVTLSNAGNSIAQRTAISVVSGTGSQWSAAGCSPDNGLTSAGIYNTDLNFVIQPDSAMVSAGCFNGQDPVNNLDLTVNQNENTLEFTGLGGDNVDAVRIVSSGCTAVFRSFIDGPCSQDTCPL